MTDEHTLLREFTERRSETAFRELVARYTDFVFSAALRQCGPAHAEDATQQVFIALARQAHTLGPAPHLGGWLHRHTRFVSLNLVRAEQRRVLREKIAMEIQDTNTDWQHVAPELDAAIDELDDDRAAVLPDVLVTRMRGFGSPTSTHPGASGAGSRLSAASDEARIGEFVGTVSRCFARIDVGRPRDSLVRRNVGVEDVTGSAAVEGSVTSNTAMAGSSALAGSN